MRKSVHLGLERAYIMMTTTKTTAVLINMMTHSLAITTTLTSRTWRPSLGFFWWLLYQTIHHYQREDPSLKTLTADDPKIRFFPKSRLSSDPLPLQHTQRKLAFKIWFQTQCSNLSFNGITKSQSIPRAWIVSKPSFEPTFPSCFTKKLSKSCLQLSNLPSSLHWWLSFH